MLGIMDWPNLHLLTFQQDRDNLHGVTLWGQRIVERSWMHVRWDPFIFIQELVRSS